MHNSRLLFYILCTSLGYHFISQPMEYETSIVESLRGRIPGLALEKKSLKDEPLSITPYGYAQVECNADSRQTFGIGQRILSNTDTLSVFFPRAIVPDINNEDINSKPRFFITPRRSTIGLLIGGPELENVSMMADMEFDFVANGFEIYGPGVVLTGDTVPSIATPRLRHSFAYLSSETWGLLIGQYWHPLIIPECWPETVDPEGVVPVEFDSFAPQIQVAKQFDCTTIMLTLASERNFPSAGIPPASLPFGSSTVYIRDAVIPNINLKFYTDLDWIFFGAAFDYKRLVPRISNKTEFFSPLTAVDEHIDSFIGEAFVKYIINTLEIRLKGFYAQNAGDLLALGGYGIATENEKTSKRTYTNISSWSIWSDISYFFSDERTHQLGMFGGFTKNLGSSEPLLPPLIGDDFKRNAFNILPSDIGYVMKVIPRYVLNWEPYVLGIEVALSRVTYDINQKLNQNALPFYPLPVNNVRVTIQLNYVF